MIVCGDCREELGKLEDQSIDLVVTSPPYDSLRTYSGDDTWNFEAFKETARTLSAKLKDGGVICWVVNDSMVKKSKSLTSFRQAIYFKDECGLLIHDTMIYQKRNFSHPEKNRYHQVFEYVFIISRGSPKTFNPIKDRRNLTAGKIGNLGVNTYTERDGSKSIRKKNLTTEFGMRHNVWLGNTRGQESMCKRLEHPAMMPKWLARDLIRSWSNEGDLVVDPFVGSGTVTSQARDLKRNFIGIDINPGYCEMARAELL